MLDPSVSLFRTSETDLRISTNVFQQSSLFARDANASHKIRADRLHLPDRGVRLFASCGTGSVLGAGRVDHGSTSCPDGALSPYGATVCSGLAAYHPVLVGGRRKQVLEPDFRRQVESETVCQCPAKAFPWHTHPLANSLATIETPTAGSSSLLIVSSGTFRSIGKGGKIITMQGCRRDSGWRSPAERGILDQARAWRQESYVVAL